MNPHDYRPISSVNEDWTSCESCHGWMVPLAKYEIEDTNYSLPDRDELLDNSVWG